MFMHSKLDHIVIAAMTLEQGVDYLSKSLGVDIPYGGEHRKMGTHNHLMRLGEGMFLEVIAINPDINPPDRPRWFGLDDPFIYRKIEQQPTLLSWVVNTSNIKALAHQAMIPIGKPEKISRGNLSWYFGLPEDGHLIAGGMLPHVIEWQTDRHPSHSMAERGCQLKHLEIYHPYPAWLEASLVSIGALDLVEIVSLSRNQAPYMVAHISTPNGMKQLKSDYET